MDKVQVPGNVTTSEKPADQPAANAEQKPAWLPEKFWTKDGKPDYEGLAKSNLELEQKQSKAAQTPEEKATADKATADAAKAAEDAQAAQSDIPGVSRGLREKATEELSKGELSEETYAELTKAGYPKNVVDDYVKGIRAGQEDGARTVTEMKAIVGGDSGYAAMVAWMQAALTPQEIAGYDKAVSGGDKTVIELAVRGMHTKYVKVNGQEPNLLGGDTSTVSQHDTYKSVAELTRDQRNPRYASDSAFRKGVEAKLGRSNILG